MPYECNCEQCRGVAAPPEVEICDNCGEEVDEETFVVCMLCHKPGCDSCFPEGKSVCLQCEEEEQPTIHALTKWELKVGDQVVDGSEQRRKR